MDTPLPRRMGSVLSNEWKPIAPSYTKIATLNDFSIEPPSKELVGGNDKGNSNGNDYGRWPSGRPKKDPTRFDETLAEIKNLDPVIYELLRERLQNLETGDCKDCPDCQAGVKMEGQVQLMEYLRKMNKR